MLIFFLIVGQPDVDMCVFTIHNKTHFMAHFLSTLPSHSYPNLWHHNLMIGW